MGFINTWYENVYYPYRQERCLSLLLVVSFKLSGHLPLA
jgi:hypothetical protein